jgi:hypothetical protein
MKSIQQAMTGALAQINQFPDKRQQASQSTHNDRVEAVLGELGKQLRSIYPAWKQSLPTTEDVQRWKQQMRQAMVENGINTIEQIERGLAAARADSRPWWPSIGQVVQWCLGVGVSDEQITSAFQRMINRQEPADDIEYATRLEVQFACRNQLPADKALALFKSAFVRITAQVQRGERIPSMSTPLLENAAPSSRDFIEQKISERMASSNRPLTPIEQRMAALRQQQRSKGRGESFKYRRSNAG